MTWSCTHLQCLLACDVRPKPLVLLYHIIHFFLLLFFYILFGGLKKTSYLFLLLLYSMSLHELVYLGLLSFPPSLSSSQSPPHPPSYLPGQDSGDSEIPGGGGGGSGPVSLFILTGLLSYATDFPHHSAPKDKEYSAHQPQLYSKKNHVPPPPPHLSSTG